MAAKQVICDTDVMIDYLDRVNTRYAATKIAIEDTIGLDNVCISAITKMELICGAVNKSDLTKINKNINRFNVIPVDNNITNTAIALVERYALSNKMAIPDGFYCCNSNRIRFRTFHL